MDNTSGSLLIAIPIYGMVSNIFFQAYTKFIYEIDSINVPVSILIQTGDSLVNRQRNAMAKQFLTQTDCSAFLQIDSDLAFTAQNVQHIWEDLQKVDVVCGLYPKKTDKTIDWVINTLPYKPENRSDSLVEIMYAGTGFLAMNKVVLESIKEKFKEEIEYQNDVNGSLEWDFFRVGVVDFGDKKRFLSEDWGLCYLARECGYKVYADTRIILRHDGSIVYPTDRQIKESGYLKVVDLYSENK